MQKITAGGDVWFGFPPKLISGGSGVAATIVSKLADLQAAVVKGGGWIVTAIIIACVVLYYARH